MTPASGPNSEHLYLSLYPFLIILSPGERQEFLLVQEPKNTEETEYCYKYDPVIATECTCLSLCLFQANGQI